MELPMTENNLLALVIDGNNLAHHVCQLLRGEKVTSAQSLHIAELLARYAHQAESRVTLKLCLDHLPPDSNLPVLPHNMRVLAAHHYQEADDLLLEWFRFYHHKGQPCLVITNDGEVRDMVRHEGGAVLLVYDFVRRVGSKPVFREPQELMHFAHTSRPTSPVEVDSWPLERSVIT